MLISAKQEFLTHVSQSFVINRFKNEADVIHIVLVALTVLLFCYNDSSGPYLVKVIGAYLGA